MQYQPVIPLEPINAERIPEGKEWVAQIKWDGVRVLTYFDGLAVRLFNRKKNERTMQYPELTDIQRYCYSSCVILDGEVIALLNGKPSFQEVMRRDGIRKSDKVKLAQKQTPITYMIFDLLYYNGEWVTGQPLRRRQDILNKIIIPQDHVQLVDNFYEAASLFKVVKIEGLEGIVCKDLNSQYLINGKDKRWQKIKNYRDLIAVIGGITLRNGVANSVLLGLYDQQGRLWYIGHAGTGKLTHADWLNFTNRVRPFIISQRPFTNKPARINEALWVTPCVTAKVRFAEWTSSHTLRQPSIQAFVQVPPEDCTFTE
ncbi:MAG: DNA ligase [Bacillota bacterium]